MSDDVSILNASYTGRPAGRPGGRYSRGSSLTPDNRRLLIYAGGLGGLLVVMVTASTLTSRHHGPVPVVEADSRPLRVKPENPGGLKVDAAESDLFSGGSGTARAQLAPPAEAPNPSGLQAQKPKPAPAPPPLAAAPSPAKPAPVAITETPPPVTAAKPAPAPAKPVTVAKEATPPAKPAAKEAQAAPKPAVLASATPARPAVTHAAVQLAALTSEAAAHEEWQKLQHQMPDAFNGRQPTITKANRDGKTFWRLRTTGFTDLAQARSFCDKVRGKGGACSVADF
ncbi:MAG: SPOR domain-containing protein [Rhodopila sp.]